MDISSLYNISSDYLKEAFQNETTAGAKDTGFDTILQSAVDMLNETSYLQNKAEEAEMQFALGYADNTHDLRIAQSKSSVALQYTVAVRDKVIEAYKEIMNMQI